MSDLQTFPGQIQVAEASPDDAVSPAGARGVMQVMPGTAANPGFGVQPAASNSLADLDRVGRQYASALLAHYGGNPVLAAAAYNGGPGRVQQWISQFGDPRSGQISNEDWVSKIPIEETRQYAAKFLGPAGQQASTPVQPTNPLMPTTQAQDASSQTGASGTGGLQAGAPNPLIALSLLQAALPSHRLVAVDYDPWALQPKLTKGTPSA